MNWFQCEQKASDFESRQQLRAEEIVAVKEAIEIISNDKVKGTLTSTLQSGLRKPHLLSPSFAVTCRTRMVSYLKEKHARKLDSKIFKTFDASAMYVAIQAVLFLYASRRTIDIVMNSSLEQALEEIKSMYEEQIGHSVAEDVFEKDGIECSFTRGCLHRSSYIAGMKADYYRYIAELRTRVLNLLRYPAIWCP